MQQTGITASLSRQLSYQPNHSQQLLSGAGNFLLITALSGPSGQGVLAETASPS